jgi:DNA-binding MarR family transcriptional regulator
MLEELMKLDNQLCFRLYSVSKKMTKAYKPLLDKFNLTYPQYIVLLILFEHSSLDFKELSNIINLKTGTLTPILQSMEKKGYISRIKNKEDKRRINVSLTEEGKTLKNNISEVPVGLQEKLQITMSMYKTLVKELDELSSILDKNIEEVKK